MTHRHGPLHELRISIARRILPKCINESISHAYMYRAAHNAAISLALASDTDNVALADQARTTLKDLGIHTVIMCNHGPTHPVFPMTERN